MSMPPYLNGASPTSPSTAAHSIKELQQRANVDKSDTNKYNVKSWVSSVNKLYEQVMPFMLFCHPLLTQAPLAFITKGRLGLPKG